MTSLLDWPPTQEQKAEILRQLREWAQQHPDEFKHHVRMLAKVAQFVLLFQQKIEAAGFADHDIGYLLRPVHAGLIKYESLKDPDSNINLADIVLLNDELDLLEKTKEPKRQAQLGEIAPEIATLKLESGRAPPRGKGRITEIARQIGELLRSAGLQCADSSIRNNISPTIREWEKKNPHK